MNKKPRKRISKKIPKPILEKLKPITLLNDKAKIKKICKENRFPFKEGGFVIGNYYPDFINTERKLIIELFNPKRSQNEVWQRIITFQKHGYRIGVVVEDAFKRTDWRKYISGMIRGFVNQ
jgi:hypothetical protein